MNINTGFNIIPVPVPYMLVECCTSRVRAVLNLIITRNVIYTSFTVNYTVTVTNAKIVTLTH